VGVVTGAGRGIGAATVHLLANRGWGVVAVDRCADDPRVPYPLATQEDLQAVAASHEAVIPLVGDVRDVATSLEAVKLAVEHFGGLDAAVAAAAVILGGREFWNSDGSELDLLLDVDFRGVDYLARASIPVILARRAPRQGRFVVVTSAAAHTGLPGLTAYGAVKHAVLGLVRGLADDLAGTGVTANAVSPGSTRTAMLEATAALYGLESVEDFVQHQAIRRIIEPEEVAAAICWILSEESSAMTGAVMQVDGGFDG
jgi:SDR family mycofactocin-dependent oxidoreductase